MTKSIKKVTTEEMDLTPQEEPAGGPVSQDEKDLHQFLGDFGTTGGRVRISRHDASGNQIFQGIVELESMSEQFLQENYGAGKYSIMLIDTKGKYVTKKVVYIGDGLRTGSMRPGGFIPPPEGLEDKHEREPAPDIQGDLVRAVLATNQAMLTQIIGVISANKGDHAGSQSTFQEMAMAMKELREVVKPAEPPDLFSKMIEVLKLGMDISSTGFIPDKKEGGWLGFAKEVLGVIPDVMTGIKHMGPAVAPTNAIQEQTMLQPTKENPLGLTPELYSQMMYGIGYLKTRCLLNKDPGLWIEMLMDNMDQDHYASIVGLTDKSIDEIAALTDPSIAKVPFRSWFERVFQGVKNAIAERDKSDGTSSGAGSDDTDSPGDASASS